MRESRVTLAAAAALVGALACSSGAGRAPGRAERAARKPAPAASGTTLSPRQLEDLYRGPARISIEGRVACAPVTGPDYLPLVDTRINGTGPYPLLLDLGSNVVLLREDVAQAAGAKFEIVREGADIARVQSMRIGGFEAHDVLIGVYEDLDVDGVLSLHFFRDHALRMDFPARELCMFDGPRPMALGGDVLPLTVTDRIPYVDVTIGELTVPMFLDTGASDWFSFPLAAAESVPLRAKPVPGPTLSNNQTGDNRVFLARLRDDIIVGPVRVQSPQAFFDPAVDNAFMAQQLLKRYVITIDTASRTIRFEGDHSAPVRVPDFSSFGVALSIASGVVRVSDRIPGTPAADHVPLGARVTRVNGTAAANLTPRQWRDIRLTAVRLELELEVDGAVRKVSLERRVVGDR